GLHALRLGTLGGGARVSGVDQLAARTGVLRIGFAAAVDRADRLRAARGGQQGECKKSLHGQAPVGSSSGVGLASGLGGLGRGGLAWIFIIARSMSPARIRSSADSELSMLFSIASRCSGEGLRST